MEDEMTTGERNLELLRKSLPSGERLYLWVCTPDGTLLSTDCPEAGLFGSVFNAMGGLDKVLRQVGQRSPRPLLIGTAIGMQWAAAFEADDRGLTRRVYILGPVFYRDLTAREVYDGFREYSKLESSLAWRDKLIGSMDKVPVISNGIFIRYAILVHNMLNSDQLSITDLTAGDISQPTPAVDGRHHDRHKVWVTERALLQMVRNGEIDYRDALNDSLSISDGVPIHGRDPLRQAKTSAIVFTSLVCRAAIEGGLSPETAYSLGDSYIQSVEDSRDSAELSALTLTMYDDFIHRVHRCRTNPNYSRQIQKCCDYIELNLNKPIRTAELGALVGYTEYYLSEKFKKETGISVSNYVKFAKVERAKVLLRSTDAPIADIAEKLAFNTVNYFIQSFKEVAGCTPAQYRRQGQNTV